MADQTPDPVADTLRAVNMPDALRAQAWDAYHAASSPDDLAKSLSALPLPTRVKADLWDLKAGTSKAAAPPAAPKAAPHSWTDTAVSLLPAAGGMAGSIIGGIGGTVAGLGVGGVPGAVGGAALGGAAGEAAKQLINRARGAAAPATPAEAATDIGTQGAAQGALELGGQMVPRALGTAATAVYRGYLKPSLAKASVGEARQIVQTALDEGLPVAKSGVDAAISRIGELNQEVKKVLDLQTGTVDLHSIAERVRAFARQKFYKPGAPMEDFNAAMKVADTIDAHPSLNLPSPMTGTQQFVSPTRANEVKQALGQDAGFGIERAATQEAQKQGYRATREAIEAAQTTGSPIGPLNARESKLIDAARSIRQAVEREANQNALVGVKSVLAAGMGGADYYRTGDPYSAAAKALAVRLALSPEVATRAAIVAYRLGKLPGMGLLPSQAARLAIATMQADR